MTQPSSTPAFDALAQPLHGLHAIEASAGTGKTFTITLLWLRLLLEEGLSVDRILVSTFTTAATAELRERLRHGLQQARSAIAAQRAGQPASKDPVGQLIQRLLTKEGASEHDPAEALDSTLRQAQSAFDLAPVSTIHGFCSAIMQRHSMELGSDPEATMIEGDTTSLQQLVVDTAVRHAQRIVPDLKRCQGIAKDIVGEVALSEDAIALPRLHGDGSEAAIARAREALQAMRPEADQRLKAIAGRTKLAVYGIRIMDALIAQEPGCYQVWFTSGKQEEIVAKEYPQWLEAVQSIRQAHADLSRVLYRDIVRTARQDYPAHKQRMGERSFDDLLYGVQQALYGPNGSALAQGLRERFQAVMVDECQDSDGIQITVFQRIFAAAEAGHTQPPTRSFLVIGDPKQSIYRFRGADLASYRRLSSHATRAAEMTTNWRSDGPLVRAIDQLYQSNSPHFSDSASGQPIPYVPVRAAAAAARYTDPGLVDCGSPEQQALIALWSPHDDKDQAQYHIARQCAQECQRLLAGTVTLIDRNDNQPRPVQASDLAVLAATRVQLHQVARALRRLGIPYQYAGRGLGSVLHSDEAHDLLAWLEALAACEQGGGHVLHALLTLHATPLYGGDGQSCQDLADDPLAQADVAQSCREQAAILQRLGPLPTLLQLVHQPQRLQRIMSDAAGERLLTNWRHCGDLLQAEWARGHRQPAALRAALLRLMAAADAQPDASMERLETDLPAVQLVTTHGSKGLEYPFVFCPFLWMVKSPQKRKSSKTVAIVRQPHGSRLSLKDSDGFAEQLAQDIAQEDEEQERLTYVALTRARHRCYLGMAPVPDSKGHSNGAQRSALARLLGLSEVDTGQWPQIIALHCLILSQVPHNEQDTAPSPDAAASTQLAEPILWQGSAYAPPRTSSFSGLKHSRGDHGLAYDRDGDADEAPRSMPGLLEGLGGGITLGNQIHDMLEAVIGNRQPLDAVVPVMDDTANETAQQQRQRRVRQALSSIVSTPLPLPLVEDDCPTLLDLQAQAIAEMHFLLPISALHPRDLSAALLQDPAILEHPQRKRWAEEIAHWTFSRLEGFLQGYIDLTFQYQGRWYVADYKTNQLPAYDFASCERCMLDSSYFLQGRLYLLALHRHLRQHDDAYDPSQHLGGCCYWFVRGFDPQQPGQGMWTDAISAPAIAALDRLCTEVSA
ncbi:MAG: hypothetical protein EA401_06590 [Planctomycetota bacterium]|nr:MAG: hypothetical protein EA401_06590 [Planctomycetota bacterium]